MVKFSQLFSRPSFTRSPQMSSESIYNFLRYPAVKQPGRQTDSAENRTSVKSGVATNTTFTVLQLQICCWCWRNLRTCWPTRLGWATALSRRLQQEPGTLCLLMSGMRLLWSPSVKNWKLCCLGSVSLWIDSRTSLVFPLNSCGQILWLFCHWHCKVVLQQ